MIYKPYNVDCDVMHSTILNTCLKFRVLTIFHLYTIWPDNGYKFIAQIPRQLKELFVYVAFICTGCEMDQKKSSKSRFSTRFESTYKFVLSDSEHIMQNKTSAE
jgi:hypothetical protein